MTATPITKKRFTGWLIVFTLGMALWTLPGNALWGIGLGFVTFGNLILMTPQERSRSLPPTELLWIFAGLVLFAALAFVSKRWLPADFGAPIASAIRHPMLIVPLWCIATLLIYRRVKAGKEDNYIAARPTDR